MEFIPIEDDLLSLEMDDVARDIYLACSARAHDLVELTHRTATTPPYTTLPSAS